MDSIRFNPVNNQASAMAPQQVPTREEAAQVDTADVVELNASNSVPDEGVAAPTDGAAETSDGKAAKKKGKFQPKEEWKRLKDAVKEGHPEKALISFAVRHPKGTAIAAGVTGLAATAAVGSLVALSGHKPSDVVEVVKDIASAGSLSDKAQAFGKIGELVGTNAVIGALVGSGGIAGVGIYTAIEGIDRISKGVKKGDPLKFSRGLRKINVGLKSGLAAGTVASYGVIGARGVIGGVRAMLSPGLKIATATLNTAVGTFQLVKGVKKKDKKDIIGGALNLGVGVAAGVSMAVGGGVVAAACTVFSLARTTFNTVKDLARMHKYYKEAKAEKNGSKEAKPGEVQGTPKENGAKADTSATAPVKANNTAPVNVDAKVKADQTNESAATRTAEKVTGGEGTQATLNLDILRPENAIWVDG